MKRLDRYLVSAVMKPFLGAQAVFVMMFICTEALTEATKLISRFGVPAHEVLYLLLLRVPWAIGWTMPMSLGMAVVLAIGRMCQDIEYTPMIVGGISFKRMMLPLVAFALLVSAFALWIEEWVGPWSMMTYHDRKNALVTKSRRPQAEVHLRRNDAQEKRRMTLTACSVDVRCRQLSQVELEIWEPEKYVSARVVAKEAVWLPAEKRWELHDAVFYLFDQAGRLRFWRADPTIDARIVAGMAGYGGEMVFSESPDDIALATTDKPDYLTWVPIRQLIARMERLHQPMVEVNRVKIYLYRRWTLASSCLIFLLIGAPLAVRPQRGATLGAAFALGMVLVTTYYIVWNATSFLGESSRYPWICAWSSNFAGAALGWWLIRRVPD